VANIEKFEDIKAWGRARGLVKKVYQLSNNKKFSQDWSLKDQIRRAAVSVMSNIAEGYSRQTDKEFIRFLYIALGSVSEVRSQLYVALDLSYISKEGFETLYSESEEITKLIGGFIRYLEGAI